MYLKHVPPKSAAPTSNLGFKSTREKALEAKVNELTKQAITLKRQYCRHGIADRVRRQLETQEKKNNGWKAAVVEWEAEQDEARLEKQKPNWKKPVRGKLETAHPKPVDPTRKRRGGVPGSGDDDGELIEIIEGSDGDESEYEDEEE
ncbi:hypothetical protein BU15DRAFT_65172 [Melanogaster broomeanus]|nr:hypothetical protein BU15DRAFT_65172 [Melanogaster broomeanus]